MYTCHHPPLMLCVSSVFLISATVVTGKKPFVLDVYFCFGSGTQTSAGFTRAAERDSNYDVPIIRRVVSCVYSLLTD